MTQYYVYNAKTREVYAETIQHKKALEKKRELERRGIRAEISYFCFEH